MIAKLTGKIVDILPEYIIVDVQGVGYKVEVVGGSFLEGQDISVYIYTHVREQELRLFGFKTRDELRLFELLLQVSGVGPKLAMTLLANVGIESILTALQTSDASYLRTSGVGAKTAERIVIDLKDKILKLNLKPLTTATAGQNQMLQRDETVAALLGLGYKEAEIRKILPQLTASPETSSQGLLKQALRLLHK